ncbi:tRNA(adenine(34)) deaminase, chloroplastic [Beta vulgaris subsp. vulgaris]|uniref:tRNA(adenine(34)) deaminase, chloroplastic n=1 Tax=Beta vulgaris subsp. vulgaris TaxID=3555 RepID=UPI00203673AD|nr:tRNA(adenine(34)) deaminase, chloroplastic [Beta vulgaris subsp. vulgaris]
MMHTTYSSSIISLRTYSTFNNYCYYSNERYPSTCCSCCCSIPINSCKLLVPTNPSFLYGLRQSTLIQCPPSRRFILGPSDLYRCRPSVYDVGGCCCSQSQGRSVDRICKEKCCVKEKSLSDYVNKSKGRVARPRRDLRSNALGDAEAMLSLLTEDAVKECMVVREKKRRSPLEGKIVSTQGVVIEKIRGRKPNMVDAGCRESELKNHPLKTGRVQSCEEGNRGKEERLNLSKDEDGGLRRRESTSSYYSLSDSGDFGSDIEVEVTREPFVKESSTSQKKDWEKSGGFVSNEAMKQDWEGYRDVKGKGLQTSAHDVSRVASSIQQDWRKKSEKKLAEESEESKYRNDSVVRQARPSQAKESSSINASSSNKQFSYHDEKATSDIKSLGQSSVHMQKDNRASRYLNSSSQHEHSTQIGRGNFEAASGTWRRSSQVEDLKIVGKSVQESGCDHCKTCGRSMEESKTQSDFRQQTEKSEMNADAILTIGAESLSESRHWKHKNSISSLQSSVGKESEQLDQIHQVIGQTSAKSESQHYQETVSTDENRIQSTLRARQQSNARMHNLAENSRTSAEHRSENIRKKEEKSSSSVQISATEEKKQHDQIYQETGQVDARRTSQHNSEFMDTDASYLQSTLRATQGSNARMHNLVEMSRTSAESQSESSRKTQQKSSRLFQTSAKEDKKRHDQIYLGTGQVDARRKTQHYNEVMDTDASYLRSTSSSQQQSETRMKHLEEKTKSTIAAEKVKRLHEKSSGKVTKDIETSKVSHTEIGDSRVQSSNLEINSQSASDKRVYNEQNYSKEKLKSVEEVVEKRKWIDETVVQSTLRAEVQGPSTRHFSEEAIISQPSARLNPHTGVQQVSGEEIESGQLLMSSPPYHHENRRSQFLEASNSPMRNAMGGTMEAGSGKKDEHPQAITLSSYGSKSSKENSPEDTLVSAARMQETSSLIVGEFVEKMSHEASTSETSSKTLSKLDSKHQAKKSTLKESTQLDTDKLGLQNQGSETSSGVPSLDSDKEKSQYIDSKLSSADYGTKESSDQMWDVKDHFVQEAPETTSLEGATSESVVAARTGKFLWNIVAGIRRLRWGSHSEKNHKSPVKRDSSPTRSPSGETWFSGDEADESNIDGLKAQQTSLLQETTSDQSLLGTTGSRKEDVVLMTLDDKLSGVDMGASSSSSVLKSSSLPGRVSVGENTNLKLPQHMSLPSPSLDLSIPPARQLRRPLASIKIDGAERNEEPISSSEEKRDDSVDERQSDVSSPEGTDVELKKRKLQRSKVVLQRYDDWEDAYRHEREQRKVDEIFMREALAEAMRAADSWEVPVGAVLVQNGKIIARGYNLVEELRDSTAHAEMLCIRQASNILRTWRLSETTLYVTLEPCPMCAGAILQARISNLVWGAPNKLLGADGSWIRLFPEGVAEEERAEASDKPAAPVHPFHPKMNIRRGILQEECADIMQQFFQLKRRKAKEKEKDKETSSDEAAQPSCFPKPHHRSKLLHKMHNVFNPSKQSAD